MTNVKEIRLRKSEIKTRNVRTLKPARKPKELPYEVDKYTGTYWGSVTCGGRTVVRCHQMTYTVYFSTKEDKHEYSVGFLIHENMVSAVLGCQSVSSRLIQTDLRAARFNVTIIQDYAPTFGHGDNEIDNFRKSYTKFLKNTLA